MRTASRFSTGSTPGRPRSTAQAWVLGGATYAVAAPVKILLLVASWAWISSPMTVSHSIRASSFVASAGRREKKSAYLNIKFVGSMALLWPHRPHCIPRVRRKGAVGVLHYCHRLDSSPRGGQCIVLPSRSLTSRSKLNGCSFPSDQHVLHRHGTLCLDWPASWCSKGEGFHFEKRSHDCVILAFRSTPIRSSLKQRLVARQTQSLPERAPRRILHGIHVGFVRAIRKKIVTGDEVVHQLQFQRAQAVPVGAGRGGGGGGRRAGRGRGGGERRM